VLTNGLLELLGETLVVLRKGRHIFFLSSVTPLVFWFNWFQLLIVKLIFLI